MFGTLSRDSPAFYYLCLGVLILMIVGTLNLLRSPTGRAFVAIRDSETAARSMGVNIALYKVKAFAISAGDHRHRRRAVRPQAVLHQPGNVHAAALDRVRHRDHDRRRFSLHGAVFGAIFIVMSIRS